MIVGFDLREQIVVQVEGEDSGVQAGGDGRAASGAVWCGRVRRLLEQGVHRDAERDDRAGGAGDRVPQPDRAVVAAGDQDELTVVAGGGDEGADLAGVAGMVVSAQIQSS
jgi:hypothetical protein